MWSIIKSCFRYNKIGSVVVMFFVIIVTLLLVVGTSIMGGVNSVVDDKIAQLGEADIEMTYILNNSDEMDRFRNHAIKYESIAEYEDTELFYTTNNYELQLPNMKREGKPYIDSIGCIPISKSVKFKLNIVNESLAESGYPVYMNNYYNIKGAVRLGDKVKIIAPHGSIEFYVAGFVDTLNSLYNNRLYMPENSYNAIKEFDESGVVYGKLDMKISNFNNREVSKFFAYTSTEFNAIQVESIEEIKRYTFSLVGSYDLVESVKVFATIISVVMIVFALLMSFVAMIVIRFLIISNIEDNVRNIGVVKALGYRNKEIRLAYALQYGIIFTIAMIIGLVLAIALIGEFAGIITVVTNVALSIPISASLAIASIILIALLMSAVLYFVTRRLGKIQPIMALRRGVSTHSFKKNRIPIEKTKVSNNTALAFKSIANNSKQSVMLVVVMLLMTVVTSFASVLYYNMNVNTSAILPVVGIDDSDAIVRFIGEYDKRALDNDKISEINSRIYPQSTVILENNITANGRGYKNYDIMGLDFSYIGRMPINDNEITVPQSIAKANGYKVGDYTKFTMDSIEYEFIICGITQGINIQGILFMTYDAVVKTYPDDKKDILLSYAEYVVNFADGVSCDMYNTYLGELGISNYTLIDHRAEIKDNVLASFAMASTMLLSIMIAITAFTLVMLIMMVVALKVKREKMSIAISKAVGYRSRDIVGQITLSMVLLSTIGSFIGVLLGALLTSPVMQIALHGYGVMKAVFLVNWWYILGVFVMIPLITVAITSLASLRVSKISPAKLRAQ